LNIRCVLWYSYVTSGSCGSSMPKGRHEKVSVRGKKSTKFSIGLDVVSSSIRIVALGRDEEGKKFNLWNYGVSSVPDAGGQVFGQ